MPSTIYKGLDHGEVLFRDRPEDPVYQTLELPTPHSNTQRILMQAFVTPGLVELWCACGTKFGKSLAGSGGLAGLAWVKKNSLMRWVAPIYQQAKIGFKYHKYLLPDDAITINNSEPSVLLKANDTKIEYRSGQHPEDLEGDAVMGYCLDEAAKMKRQVYDSAKTTVTITRGPIVGFSTPNGKGWFYDKCMEAKAHMEWSLKKGIPPTKIFITAPSSTNPMVTPEAIEEARRSLSERLFKQYFLAEFLDDGSVFMGFRECAFPVEWEPTGHIHEWFHVEHSECEVIIGVDWAKKTDYTVFIAMDLTSTTPMVVGYCRFQGLSYIEAIKQLLRFSKKFKRIHLVRHDKTGVGEAIDDMLAGTMLACQGVVFTNASKTNMVNELMLTFERKDIAFPAIPDIVYELDIYEVKTSVTGTMRYEAPTGCHDDIVSALFLANSGVQEMRGGFNIRFLEDLPKERLTLDKYYAEMMQEIEDD